MKPVFNAGRNIALKVPSHEYNRTVSFYRDVLGLETEESVSDAGESVVFQFGDKRLWVDNVDSISQAEIWLEVVTDDIDAASAYLEGKDCTRRDDIEALPEGFRGFWIAGPSNIIHLVTGSDRQGAK